MGVGIDGLGAPGPVGISGTGETTDGATTGTGGDRLDHGIAGRTTPERSDCEIIAGVIEPGPLLSQGLCGQFSSEICIAGLEWKPKTVARSVIDRS